MSKVRGLAVFLLITSYLPKTYIRPVLTSLLTTFSLFLVLGLYNYYGLNPCVYLVHIPYMHGIFKRLTV